MRNERKDPVEQQPSAERTFTLSQMKDILAKRLVFRQLILDSKTRVVDEKRRDMLDGELAACSSIAWDLGGTTFWRQVRDEAESQLKAMKQG